jgi:replication factor C subunit 3/5
MSPSLPWVEKYRPNNLDELLSHQDIIQTINNFIEKNSLPHLLFHGPAGTGKTSAILACARQMYGNKFNQMTLDLNASDDRGIDVVREQIKNFVSSRTLYQSNQPKLVILDEADHMTSTAQFALRRMIEQYSSNARFCLICNYSSQIIPALQSRCTKFRFGPLESSQMSQRMIDIARNESVFMTEDGLESLLRIGKGDMRRTINILQSVALAFPEKVDAVAVHLTTGVPLPGEIDHLFMTLLTGTFKEGFSLCDDMRSKKGYAAGDVITELHRRLASIEIPVQARLRLHANLADIEYRLAQGGTEKIQIAGLIGSFFEARNLMK